VLADGREQQVQRLVHVPEEGRDIAGADHGLARGRVGERRRVQDDVAVIGAGVPDDVLDVGASAVSRMSSGTKLSAWPVKSTAKLRSRPLPSARSRRAAIAVRTLESSPPDSSMHSGTSATSCRATMSSSSSRTRATVAGTSSAWSLAVSCQ
jgi:hypothetical protein